MSSTTTAITTTSTNSSTNNNTTTSPTLALSTGKPPPEPSLASGSTGHKRAVYSSKSKTIIHVGREEQQQHQQHQQQLQKTSTVSVLSEGVVTPFQNSTTLHNYQTSQSATGTPFFPTLNNFHYFPPFPSPPTLNQLSNSLALGSGIGCVDLMNQSGYSTSSSGSNCTTPPNMEKCQMMDSIPIKKRKNIPLSDISNSLSSQSNQIQEFSSKSDKKKRKHKTEDFEEKQKEKKEKRLIRNRQSAQASRERKKHYIQSLEEKVAELEKRVMELEEENEKLRTNGK